MAQRHEQQWADYQPGSADNSDCVTCVQNVREGMSRRIFVFGGAVAVLLAAAGMSDVASADGDDSASVPESEELKRQLKVIAVSADKTIASIDLLLINMRAVSEIGKKLKNMNESEKKQLIKIAKDCGLIEIAKTDKILNKEKSTPEGEKFLYSQIQLILNSIRSNILKHRTTLIGLLPRVQIMNAVESSDAGDSLFQRILECISRTKDIKKM
jgi:hypothetical protein